MWDGFADDEGDEALDGVAGVAYDEEERNTGWIRRR